MKSLYLFLFACLFAFTIEPLQAQVNIAGSDLPAVGTQKYVAVTNTPDIDLGAASSTAQVWDFTSLEPGNYSSAVFTSTDGLPSEGTFPQSTIARTGPINSILGISLGDILPIGGGGLPEATAYYVKNSQGKVLIDGFNMNVSIPGLVDLGPTDINAQPNDLYLTPADFGDVIENDGGYIMEISLMGFNFGLRFNVDKVINVDAFGTLQLPDYNLEVLRYNESNTVGVELGLVPFPGIFIPVDPATLGDLLGVEIPFDLSFLDTTVTTNSYRFISKNQGYPAASVTMLLNPISGTSTPASIEYLAQPGPLQAEYNFTVNCLTVAFSNASANALAYDWDFGTGDVSTLEDPIYTFPEPGTYEVSLTALGIDGISAVVTKEVTVDFCLDIDEVAANSIIIYPNPTTGTVNFDLTNNFNNCTLTLTNLLGQNAGIWNNLNGKVQLDISRFSKGVYFYTLSSNEGNVIGHGKLIVE
ncbi:MAG: T9SS type A sorting domain-containing protein [Sphingobacteriales bacterium]|nr:MAG: T9SS type A sorting domain-containing protein [Sphingobacteriales bacterium]